MSTVTVQLRGWPARRFGRRRRGGSGGYRLSHRPSRSWDWAAAAVPQAHTPRTVWSTIRSPLLSIGFAICYRART